MDKFAGIKLASFIVGVLLPIVVVTGAWLHVTKAPIPVETETVIEYEPSMVDTFVVDYDQYGNMYVGETIVRCEIVNNSMNTMPCNVYLVDDNGIHITETEHLLVTGRASVLDIVWDKTEPGEYPVSLVYEVETETGKSIVTCPYIILLNGGYNNVER